VKISVKHLDYISNPLSSADCCNQESVAMGVEWFGDGFLDETRLGDRLNNEQIPEISRDFGYAHESLLTLPEQRSGLFFGYEEFAPKQQQRYRFKSAVPI
jgi:hypothetical protein